MQSKTGWNKDKGTADLSDQTTGDWINREVVGGLVSDKDLMVDTAVGEGISLATETIVDNGVEGIDNGYGEGIDGIGEGIAKSEAFNVGG